MSRTIAVIVVCSLVLASVAFTAVAPNVIPITVVLSPSALVIGGPGEWVTAHTDVRFSVVDRGSVALGSIPAASVYSDNRGYMVAKFHRADVEAIVAPPNATLTLTGLTTDGVRFAGSDSIRVMLSQKK